ncbi:MAG TPA: TraR/DksA C4-type zinc finger protein [Solirubrobacteraceae bacterium]|nr:TraR/DksA C4-type zinc finger protein [Solirubrobacteraceae bacterium]
MDPDRARELLKAERERIERTLADLAPQPSDELADVDQHLGDAATELFDEERDEGLATSLREELAAVDRAEQRLAEGRYGTSVESGEPIPDARLEAQPTAERTVEEQARYERGG